MPVTYTLPLVGTTFIKHPNRREAQITATYNAPDGIRATMYWPDTNTQTTIRLDRLTPHHHWHQAPED